MSRFENGFQEAAAAFVLRKNVDAVRFSPEIPESIRKDADRAHERLGRTISAYTGNSRAARAAVAQGSWKCWYTGEALDPSLAATDDPLAPTAEHLRAKSNGGGDGEDNVFVCARWINSLVSDEPVAVKMEVRRKFTEMARAFPPAEVAGARRFLQRKAAAAILRARRTDAVRPQP